MSKIPKSVFSRGTKLMGLASKVAYEGITSKLKTWETEKEKIAGKVQLAQDMVKTLSQLKGASMKLGQLLSFDLGEYVPPEILKILEQLHHQSTFLAFDQIEPILKRELKERYSDLKDISPRPIAAASIGQVHKARLNGKDVVIKVQYPGVADSIPSDMKILKMIVKQFSFFQGKEVDFTGFFQEVEEVLRKETDYENELKMHLLYREKFLSSHYVIPEVFPNYSSKTVLTSEYIEGKSISEWMNSNNDDSKNYPMAEKLLQLYLDELFKFGVVQTDPNPGNFLITEDDDLALLDFGAVKVYSSEFTTGYRNVLKYAYHNNEGELLQESFRLGFIDAREDKEVHDIYLKMMDFLVEPFRQEKAFDFNDKDYFNLSRDLSWSLTRKCKYSPPPKDLIFLHRKLVGVFGLVKKLDVKLTLSDYWHHVES